MNRAVAVLLMVVATTLPVAGCASNSPDASTSTEESGAKLNGDFSGAGEVPGALVSANALKTLDMRLKQNSSIAARVTYTSTSGIDDSHTEVTGTVFVPTGSPPQGGWPVVAYAHPDTGSQSNCAPSVAPDLANSSELVTALVQAGYVVTMPDYQGLGNDSSYHPYLDSTTAGYNVIDSVRAARRLSPDVSQKWLALGTGQGGQAAWAANELFENYGGDLNLIGSATLSPTADVNGLADAAAAGDLTKDQKLALVRYLDALNHEYDLRLDDFRRGAVTDNWNLLLSCSGADADVRSTLAGQINPDDLRPASPEAVDVLRGYLQKTSLPLGPTTAPMLVIYGGRDRLIPAPWTAGALDAACKMGDVIDIEVRPDDTTQIDPSAALGWIAGRFAGDPPVNSCGAIPSPRETTTDTEAAPTEAPVAAPEETVEATQDTQEAQTTPTMTAPATTTQAVGPLPGPATTPPTAAVPVLGPLPGPAPAVPPAVGPLPGAAP
jgi:hypothetical protein